MEMKNRIIKYMKLHELDAGRIAEEIGIDIGGLTQDSGVEMSADELCRLCVYLNVRPEDFYSKKIKPEN